MVPLFKKIYFAFLSVIFPTTGIEQSIAGLINHTIAVPPHIQLIGNGISCFSYKNKGVRDLLWQLKYKGDTRVAKIFGEALAPHLQTYLNNTTLKGPYLVSPIPLSKRRLWWRGYNQGALIAQALCEKNPQQYIYSPTILYRTKHKTAQAKIKDPAQRLFNARGLFAVTDPKEVANKTIILVDDVITTGATLREATNVLKKAGAHHVVWLVIAH